MKNRLKSAFKKLAETPINVDDYPGDLHDTAFDLWYTNVFIAGIADRILSGDSIDSIESDVRTVISKPFIFDKTFWTTTEGLSVDLRNHEELFELAKQVEEVRRICVSILSLRDGQTIT